MFSLDGVALRNTTYGWRIKAQSNPWTGQVHSLADFNATNRDGTVQTRGFIQTPTVVFVVTTPEANLESLRKLFRMATTLTKTADATKSVTVELISMSVDVWTTGGNGLYAVTGTFRVPSVFWRDASTTTFGPTSLTTTGQTISVFTSTTGVVRDALISVGGSVTGLAVQASNGTYFTYAPNVPSGTFLTFDSTNGRAWTGASAFTKTTEVTTNIANGPGPYFLEIAPQSSNPATTGCLLTLTWTAMTGATVRVQGANAYDR